MIKVSENGRYFTCNSKPFFMLADTAWNFFQRLDISEMELYMRNRKEKGFNTIYAVLVNNAASTLFFDSLKTGINILEEKADNYKRQDLYAFDSPEQIDVEYMISDISKPYWGRVVAAVEMAKEMGLHMGLLPVWGDIVKNKQLSSDNLYKYLNFLVQTFGSFDNIFWILGGDIRGDDSYEIWNKMGTYLKDKMKDHIIGYHPFGRTSSSYWFHAQEWLDFNMFQSGHRRSDQRNLNAWDERAKGEPWYGEENFRYVQADYIKTPAKPVLDGEPSYEQIPQGLHNPEEPYWLDHHVRRYAYWSAFSGAAGHVYGHNSVMQFFKEGTEPAYGAKETWDKSIHDAGGSQMRYLKELMDSIDFIDGKPMQYIPDISVDYLEDNILVFGTEKHYVCYSFTGKTIILNNLKGVYEHYWFDPVNGVSSYAGSIRINGSTELNPPSKKYMWNDWVLILKRIEDI